MDVCPEPIVCNSQCIQTWASSWLSECPHGRVQCLHCGHIWKVNLEVGCEHSLLLDNTRRVEMRFVSSTAKIIYRASGKANRHDVCSDVDINIAPNTIVTVNTGLLLEMPERMCASIRGRCMSMFSNDIFALDKVIDYDYRGEVKIKLINLSEAVHSLRRGDTIGNIVFLTYGKPDIVYIIDILSQAPRRDEDSSCYNING